MVEMTERLQLPLLQTAQAQKEVTHNEALARLDRWCHPRIASRTLAVPPATAAIGEIWIVPPAASGDWAGRNGQLAEWAGAWRYMTPVPGLLVWIEDENAVTLYGAGGWEINGLPVSGLSIDGNGLLAAIPQAVAEPVGGATIDSEARNAISLLLTNLRALGLVAG